MPHHIGFLADVLDLFHVGHLDVLERARQECDRLVVGVLTADWALAASCSPILRAASNQRQSRSLVA